MDNIEIAQILNQVADMAEILKIFKTQLQKIF